MSGSELWRGEYGYILILYGVILKQGACGYNNLQIGPFVYAARSLLAGKQFGWTCRLPAGYRQEILFGGLSESLKNSKYPFAVKKKGKAVG